MNKKQFILFFLILIFVPIISSLDCQYTETEHYIEREKVFYHNDEIIGYNLSIDELFRVEISYISITIYNDLDYDTSIELNYTLYSSWFGTTDKKNITLEIPAKDKKNIQEALDPMRYSIRDLVYSFIPPDKITWGVEDVDKKREICSICPNGKQCLDDEASCSLDIECGAEICNPDKKCGSFENGCSSGKKFCEESNLCLLPIILKNQEPYSCDWECENGTIACDGICRQVSVKKAGEEYQCIQECKSERGKDNKCLKSKEWWIIFLSSFILIFGIGSYLIFRAFNKKDWDKKKRSIIDQANEKAKKIMEKSQKDLEDINDDLKEKINQKRELREELDKKENAQDIKKEIIKINKEIEELSKEQQDKKIQLKKEREEFEKERLKPFTNKQGMRVHLNENGYEVFEKNGALFHRWWFEHNKKRKIKFRHEIHHKDFNKRNNDIENLEELTSEEHTGIDGRHRNKNK